MSISAKCRRSVRHLVTRPPGLLSRTFGFGAARVRQASGALAAWPKLAETGATWTRIPRVTCRCRPLKAHMPLITTRVPDRCVLAIQVCKQRQTPVKA